MNRKDSYKKAILLITEFKGAIRTDAVTASNAIQGWDNNRGIPLLGMGKRITGVGGSAMSGKRD